MPLFLCTGGLRAAAFLQHFQTNSLNANKQRLSASTGFIEDATARTETGDTKAFVNTYYICAANGLFGAHAAARTGLRRPFSLTYTRGAIWAPHPSFIPFSPTASSCFFHPLTRKTSNAAKHPIAPAVRSLPRQPRKSPGGAIKSERGECQGGWRAEGEGRDG